MKTRLNVLLATAGIAAVLLAGCVSSKKYKASQATLQQVRDDSTKLAEQVASLNENVHGLEQKNTTLQRSLDSTSSSCATQQKSLDYYQGYFNKQQGTMSQVSEELKGALSQAGLANEDVQQENGTIYVRLDESKVFKKNSTAVTSSGKQALSSLAQVIKNRSSDVNVFVGNDDSSTGQTSMASDMSSSGMANATDNATADNMSANPSPRHRKHHSMGTRKSTSKSAASAQNDATKPAGESAATAQNSGKSNAAPAHKRVHRKYSSEGSMTYVNNGPKYSKNKSWALKQARVNTVANSFLQNGVQKVNVSMQQPTGNEQNNNNIKVIITPTMSDFNPEKSSSAKTETK